MSAFPLRKGPSGPVAEVSNTDDAKVVRFDFSGGIIPLELLRGGETLYRADIRYIVPFDGLLPTVMLGTTANPSLIFGPSDSIPTSIDQFQTLLMYFFASVDTLILTINPSGSTQGSGVLLYELRR
jgi:hypothetical protein